MDRYIVVVYYCMFRHDELESVEDFATLEEAHAFIDGIAFADSRLGDSGLSADHLEVFDWNRLDENDRSRLAGLVESLRASGAN